MKPLFISINLKPNIFSFYVLHFQVTPHLKLFSLLSIPAVSKLNKIFDRTSQFSSLPGQRTISGSTFVSSPQFWVAIILAVVALTVIIVIAITLAGRKYWKMDTQFEDDDDEDLLPLSGRTSLRSSRVRKFQQNLFSGEGEGEGERGGWGRFSLILWLGTKLRHCS